jgi:simple sugar transport system permease protein
MGLFVVLVSGGIDISFAATASVAAIPDRARRHRPRLAGLCLHPLGLAIGTLLGCINAILIHYLRITSIIITIATMSAYFRAALYFSKGKSIYTLPDWLSTRVVFYQAELAGGGTVGLRCRSSSCLPRSSSPMS